MVATSTAMERAAAVRAPDVGGIALSWWRGLTNREIPAARRAWAELRRAYTPQEVALTPAYVQLAERIAERTGREAPDRAAAIALALAAVKPEQGRERGSVARAMRTPPTGIDRPPVSEQRFRRLLQIDDLESLAAALRRITPMLATVPVPDLAMSVFHWGDARKRRWAELYWTGFTLEEDGHQERTGTNEEEDA